MASLGAALRDGKPGEIAPDVLNALGSLLTRDGARILSVANSLRGSGRSVESLVEGGSMGRTIPAGTTIRIDLVTRETFAPGEVIAFFVDTTLVVHRVLSVLGNGYLITRGDGTLSPDPPLRPDHVLGPVSAMRREETWEPVPAAAKRSLRARALGAALSTAVRMTTRLSPGMAARLALFIHRAARDARPTR